MMNAAPSPPARRLAPSLPLLGPSLACLLLLACLGLPHSARAETEAETIARCLQDLQSPDDDLRQRAVLVLGKYNNQHARGAIIDALEDPAAVVRRSALVALVQNGKVDSTNAPYLLRMIGDPDVQVRRLASYHVNLAYLIASYTLDGRDRAALTAAFLDDDPTVRKNMIAAYRMLSSILPLGHLRKLLQDPERDVRSLALEAAVNMLPPRDLPAYLQPLVTDADSDVRARVARHLGRSHHPAAEPLLQTLSGDAEASVALAARIGLFQLSPSAQRFDALRPALDDARITGDELTQIMNLLAADAHEGLPILVALLSHERAAVRLAAATAYAMNYPADGNVPVLLQLLQDDSGAVRSIALALLVGRHPDLPADTIMALTRNPNADVRAASIRLARRLPPDAATDIMTELILDDATDVRAGALQEIGARRLDGWQDILQDSLADPDREIVIAAIDALLRTGSPDAFPILETFVRTTKDDELRRAIAAQLERLKRASSSRETL